MLAHHGSGGAASSPLEHLEPKDFGFQCCCSLTDTSATVNSIPQEKRFHVCPKQVGGMGSSQAVGVLRDGGLDVLHRS